MRCRQQRLWDLELNLADYHTFVNVAPLFHLILQTGDLVAVMILLMAARVIKYLRVFPYWGPMVVAVIMTWLDPSVILYLIVAVGLTAAMAVAFLVAFGTQVLEYSTIPESVFTLFTMVRLFHASRGLRPHAPPLVLTPYRRVVCRVLPRSGTKWKGQRSEHSTPSSSCSTSWYVCRIHRCFACSEMQFRANHAPTTAMAAAQFAVVLLNLFIGIVTDVYPKARQKSQQEWENLITDLMQVRCCACFFILCSAGG